MLELYTGVEPRVQLAQALQQQNKTELALSETYLRFSKSSVSSNAFTQGNTKIKAEQPYKLIQMGLTKLTKFCDYFYHIGICIN